MEQQKSIDTSPGAAATRSLAGLLMALHEGRVDKSTYWAGLVLQALGSGTVADPRVAVERYRLAVASGAIESRDPRS